MTIGLVLIPWEFWTARAEKKPDRVLQAHEYVSFLQKLQAVDVNMVTGGGRGGHLCLSPPYLLAKFAGFCKWPL